MIVVLMAARARDMLPLIGAVAVLAGCSGEPATVTDKDAILRLTLTEYRIKPQNIEVRATSPYQRIVVVAKNDGRLTHNVVIEPEDAADAQGVATDRVDPPLRTTTAQPGQTVRQAVYLRPGKYRVLSSIANQQNLGMYGSLTVTAADK